MEKVIFVNEAYVSCVTCDVCYGQDDLPVFCQDGFRIDPRAVLENMERAANCKRWFPKVIGRQAAGDDYPSTDRWYEKDSIG